MHLTYRLLPFGTEDWHSKATFCLRESGDVKKDSINRWQKTIKRNDE